MYVLMSTFELSLDSIWFLCFCESALHQYYMPTLAEEGFFLLGNGNHRKHKHSAHKQQKLKLFPDVEKEEGLTGGETFNSSWMWEDKAKENTSEIEVEISAQ